MPPHMAAASIPRAGRAGFVLQAGGLRPGSAGVARLDLIDEKDRATPERAVPISNTIALPFVVEWKLPNEKRDEKEKR